MSESDKVRKQIDDIIPYLFEPTIAGLKADIDHYPKRLGWASTPLRTLQTLLPSDNTNTLDRLTREYVNRIPLSDTNATILLSNDSANIQSWLDQTRTLITHPPSETLKLFQDQLLVIAGFLEKKPSSALDYKMLGTYSSMEMKPLQAAQFSHFLDNQMQAIRTSTGVDLSQSKQLSVTNIHQLSNVESEQVTPDLLEAAKTRVLSNHLINHSAPFSSSEHANTEVEFIKNAKTKLGLSAEQIGNVYILSPKDAQRLIRMTGETKLADHVQHSVAFRFGGNTFLSKHLFDGTLPKPTRSDLTFIMGHELGHDHGLCHDTSGKAGELHADSFALQFVNGDAAKATVRKYMMGEEQTHSSTHPAGATRLTNIETTLTDALSKPPNQVPETQRDTCATKGALLK